MTLTAIVEVVISIPTQNKFSVMSCMMIIFAVIWSLNMCVYQLSSSIQALLSLGLDVVVKKLCNSNKHR